MARKPDPVRELTTLQHEARTAAEKLEGLQHQLRARRLAAYVAHHRARFGERAPLADLAEAARTLRCYAGFLELMISAVKRQSETPTPPALVQ